MKNTIPLALLSLAWGFAATSSPASAAVYTDRAQFESAVTGMVTLDFEGLVGTPEYPENYPWGIGHYTSPMTVQDLEFSQVDFGADYVYILDKDAGDATHALNSSSFFMLLGRSNSRVTLPAGTTAFATDYGLTTHVTGTLSATLYFRDMGPTEVLAMPVEATSQFIGFTGREIDYVVFDKLAGSSDQYMVFDNMSIAQAVPEPEAYALMLAGLGLVGLAARRRGS